MQVDGIFRFNEMDHARRPAGSRPRSSILDDESLCDDVEK
jgi:hypothetical protein